MLLLGTGKAYSEKKTPQFKARVQKPYPIWDPEGAKNRCQKNHALL